MLKADGRAEITLVEPDLVNTNEGNVVPCHARMRIIPAAVLHCLLYDECGMQFHHGLPR